MKNEMSAKKLDEFINAILAAKTFKEAKAIEKEYNKTYDEEDLIRSAMNNHRESELAQMTAYAKDLEDKQPITIRIRLAKFRKKVRLFLYYHQSVSFYSAFLSTLVAGDICMCLLSTPNYWQWAFDIIVVFLLAESLGYWFRNLMHRVM